MPRPSYLAIPLLFLVSACANAPAESGRGSVVTPGAGADAGAGADGGGPGRIDVPDAAGAAPDGAALDGGPSTPGADASPGAGPEGLRACEYRSNGHDGAMLTLDADPSSTERLTFIIEDMPDPSSVEAATLYFDSYDADHPGSEGRAYVNGVGPFDLPADTAWDNAEGIGAIDVLAALVPGDNLVEFGPGPLSRSYFRIGRVAIEAEARVTECSPAPVTPEPPPGTGAVERSIGYRDAVYSNRATWVVLCSDYAFTARGAEHVPSDCDGAFRAGGSRLGTATFQFRDLIPAEYEVWIRSRHTENRNPRGALFVVDGVERRISQRSDRDRTDDLWGTATLGGDVDVVLDSTREGESDSVINVRLRPVR